MLTGKQNSDQIQQLQGSTDEALEYENKMEAFAKETNVFLEELVSAVGLQRFRFIERQSKGKQCILIYHIPFVQFVFFIILFEHTFYYPNAGTNVLPNTQEIPLYADA